MMRFDSQKGWFTKGMQIDLSSVIGYFVKTIWTPLTPPKLMKFGHNVLNSVLYNI